MKKRLKINGVIIFLSFVLLVLFPSVFFRKARLGTLDEIAKIFGIALILFGQIIRVSSRGYKSEHSRAGCALIQGGPYAMVRNPMYLGILLIGLGVVSVLFEWWVFLALLLFFVLRYFTLIFQEEKKLLNAFPRDYPNYMRRIRRLLPSLGVLTQKDVSAYLPLKLSWVQKEIGTILAVLCLVLLLELWQDLKNGLGQAYLKEALAMLAVIILFVGVAVYLIIKSADK